MEEELNRVFDNWEEEDKEDMMDEEPKKKKIGRGRSKVVQNEPLPHGPLMFRNKIHTLLSNTSHIVHQSGCNATVIIKDSENRVYTYISPKWRSTYRNNPEAYGTIVNMSKECEDAQAETPHDKSSYSKDVPYTPVEVVGNVREANTKTLVKRPMDTYMIQQLTTIPLKPTAGKEVDEDGEDIDPLQGMRKKIMLKRQEKEQEEEQEEKDLKKARDICSAFENANIVSTGYQKAPKPSFAI